ncbi:hypothetical protein M9H77_09170 [Catharanthus roseus]|uniref:Uncharacterized protein n=1 Tax=Catharanthus roseus TaxID=4058 RepID=A0ACC0BZY7_CATRO|nr:hypothetical protein M9H77_09170 [Catharanthus roseus]
MDSFEEFLQENVGCEVRKSINFFFSNFWGNEDPNTFKEFLEPEEYIDLGHLFTTDLIFSSKDELRRGTVKKNTKPIVDDEEEEIPIKRRGPYETKKCGCSFKLKGEQMATSKTWQLFIHNGRHNHKIAVYNHGHV